MKKIICSSISLLLFASLMAQNKLIDLPVDEAGKVNYSEVVKVDSSNKEQLYLNSKQFFVDVFKSANNVIQLDDKSEGIIVGKGMTKFPVKVIGQVTFIQLWFTIKIQSKEGRYKYEIYNLYFENGSPTAEDFLNSKSVLYKKDGSLRDVSIQYKTEMEKEVQLLIQSIKSYMSKTSDSKKNDW